MDEYLEIISVPAIAAILIGGISGISTVGINQTFTSFKKSDDTNKNDSKTDNNKENTDKNK